MKIKPKTQEEVKDLHNKKVRVGDYEGVVNATFSYSSIGAEHPHYAVCSNWGCRDVYLGEELDLLVEENGEGGR